MSAKQVFRLGSGGCAHTGRQGLHHVRGILLLIAVMLLGVLGLAPAAAAATGSISGTVTDATTTNPVKDIAVIATSGSNSYPAACTATDGTYTVGALPAGTYTVEFAQGCGGPTTYAIQWYHGKGSAATADHVTVTLGAPTTKIDAALKTAGSIAGKVTDATTQKGTLAEVTVFDSAGNPVDGTCTASDGTYSIGTLAPGYYRVAFGGPDCGGPAYVTQYYYGRASLATADAVHVTATKTTSGIDAVLGGGIKGTVTNASTGAKVGLIEADVYDSAGKLVADTCTRSDGTYAIVGLATGSYRVRFSNQCGAGNFLPQFYSGKSSLATADTLAVTSTSVVTANAAMVVGGRVSGTVRSGYPYPWTPVEAAVDLYNSSGTDIGSVCSAADGTYSFSALPTGTYYVKFSTGCGGGSYVTQFYSGKSSLAVANPVYVTAGSLRGTVDAYMTPATTPPWPYSAISGTVVNAGTGAPVGLIAVNVYNTSGNVVHAACTAVDGTYSVGGLTEGTYRVGFSSSGCGSADTYVGQFYSGKTSLANADSVYARAGSTTYWVNAALQYVAPVPTGQLGGAVTDGSTHGAIGGASVSVYGSSGNVVQAVNADSYGHYSIAGLKPGSYRVGFTAKGYVAQFYNNKSSLAKADAVTVLSGSTTQWVDAALTLAPIGPRNTLAPAINGSAAVGQWLFVSSGKWAGTAPLSYQYQWQRCTASCSNITGATDSSYKPVTADVGTKLRVVVTASNTAGHASATSNAVGPIPALPPTPSQIKSAMLAQLWPTGYSADIDSLLHNGAYIYKFNAQVRGKLVISWYYLPKGAHLTTVKGPKPVLVARGQTVYSKAGKGRVKVTLTTAGKKLLRTTRRVKITCQGSFTPTGKSAIVAVKTFTLKH